MTLQKVMLCYLNRVPFLSQEDRGKETQTLKCGPHVHGHDVGEQVLSEIRSDFDFSKQPSRVWKVFLAL